MDFWAAARIEIASADGIQDLLRLACRRIDHDPPPVPYVLSRQEMRIMGKGCKKPEESCLSMGMAAKLVMRTGRGRPIDREEALAILRRAEEVGLVLQPSNSKKAPFI